MQYRSLISQEPHRIRVARMLAAAALLSVVLLVWLLQPEHWTERNYVAFDWLPALDIVMLVAIGLIELFRCLNVLSTHTPPWSPATRSRWCPRPAPGSPS
ncbi:hypothetical protein SVIOM342S_06304 [Streptomyces violaceorubidus]